MPNHFTWHNLKREFSQHGRGNRLPRVIGLLRQELRNMRNPEFFHANRLLGEGNICSYWSYLLERANEGRLPFQDTIGTSRYFAHKVWL